MIPNQPSQFCAPFWTGLLAVVLPVLAQADVVTGTNGERFVGTVIEETTNNVVFESELAGRLIFPQSKIRELQRTSPGAASPPWN